MTTERAPIVSVIIPVRDNREGLARLLGALNRQTYPFRDFEVVVVSNGTPRAPQLFFAESYAFPVRYLHEPRPGSYRARNRGVLDSRGTILAFTDSDCIPGEDWLEKAVGRLQNFPGGAVVAGNILPWEVSAPRNALQNYQLIDFFPQAFYVAQCRFGATACLITTREVFTQVGPFSERLFSGGDVEWGERACVRFPLLFAPEVIVRHPLRRTFREVFQRERRCAGGLGGRRRLAGGRPFSEPFWSKIQRKVQRNIYRLRQWAELSDTRISAKVLALIYLAVFQAVWIAERARVWGRGEPVNL